MKNLFFFFLTGFIITFSGYSQSITLNPNSLQLPQFATNPGCTVNDKGKLIFNTTQNAMLYCDGTAWKTVKKDGVYPFTSPIQAIQFNASGTPPWAFAGQTATVVLDGSETVIGSATGVFGHNSNNPVLISASMCYQLTSGGGGAVTPFYSNSFPDFFILAAPLKTGVSVVGAVNLPAGTYKIGMAIRNKSTTVNLGSNDYVIGVVQVNY